MACEGWATALARTSPSSTATPTARWNGCLHLQRNWSGSVSTSSSPGPIRSTVATKAATTTIPIVMVGIVDPVGTRLVASLARPGGNVTGLAVDAGGEILGKRFELLKEMMPNLSRLGIMWNPDVVVNRSRQAAMTETARTLGLTTIPVEVRGVETLEQAFATMTKEHAQAFVVQGDSVLHEYRGQIAEMALRNQLPSAAVARYLAEAGFLLSYGADLLDYIVARRASLTRFSRVRNLRTCRPNSRPSSNW